MMRLPARDDRTYVMLFLLLTGALGPNAHGADVTGYLTSQAAAQVLRDIHPSLVGAIGTGEQLARNAPIIQRRLRATRDAIEALGDDPASGRVSSDPLAVIKDSRDRERLAKYLKELEYLTGLVELAWDDDERKTYVEAIRHKVDQIDGLFTRYTGHGADISAIYANLEGSYECRVHCPAVCDNKSNAMVQHRAEEPFGLRFTNECGTVATGILQGPDTIVVDDWNITGTVLERGAKIRWSNGSVWAR